MYEPEKPKTSFNFFIFIGLVSILGWLFYYFYKPSLIEASCSDIAYNSYKINSGKSTILNPGINYDSLKAQCLEDAYEYDSSK